VKVQHGACLGCEDYEGLVLEIRQFPGKNQGFLLFSDITNNGREGNFGAQYLPINIYCTGKSYQNQDKTCQNQSCAELWNLDKNNEQGKA
jgi:hypothetical protein